MAEALGAVRQVELMPYPSPLAGRVASEASRVGSNCEMQTPPRRGLRPRRPSPKRGRDKRGKMTATAQTSTTAVPAAAANILAVNNIEVIYDHVILVLKGVSLDVPRGGITALLGANGAGKTTTLKAISNLLHSERGEVTKGSIIFDGEEVQARSPNELVRRGCVQVMEGRHCFGHLTIEENLLTGAFTRRDGRAAIKADLERVYGYFSRLKERRGAMAGYTSGGEQQMCAIGRALMSRPKMILLDEPSMGLAPQIVEEIFEIVRDLNQKENVSFLLAEQNTYQALKYAKYGYILENGRVVMDGDAKSLRENEDVKEFYLGIAEGKRKSFRDVKHYKRRKRWLA
jgi:branched-chain amino acid transport system ATP-binding protein